MNKKLRIEICTGTTCYVLGGAQLMLLSQQIPANLNDRVEVAEVKCLQACKAEGAKPPFVKIGDFLMSEASPGRIIDYLRHSA